LFREPRRAEEEKAKRPAAWVGGEESAAIAMGSPEKTYKTKKESEQCPCLRWVEKEEGPSQRLSRTNHLRRGGKSYCKSAGPAKTLDLKERKSRSERYRRTGLKRKGRVRTRRESQELGQGKRGPRIGGSFVGNSSGR